MKDIPGYEGQYAITKEGRVWTHKRKTWLKNITHRQGYINTQLWINGKNKKLYIHRVLALAYIPNLLNLPQINHKNGIKSDNGLKNLEWCDQSANMRHAHDTGLKVNLSGMEHGNAVPLTYNGDTKCYAEWGRKMGISGLLIRQRILRDKWSIKRALTTPVKSI